MQKLDYNFICIFAFLLIFINITNEDTPIYVFFKSMILMYGIISYVYDTNL